MMTSYNFSYWLRWYYATIMCALLVTKSECMSPFHPQCSQSVCQILPSHLNVPQCHQDECSNVKEDLERRKTSCINGCRNFKKAMLEYPVDGCSKLCNLTQLETSFSWSDNFERLPTLACVYGCERTMKDFVAHILSEIKTIRPPQILRNRGNHKTNNETSETVTFDKKAEKDILGKFL